MNRNEKNFNEMNCNEMNRNEMNRNEMNRVIGLHIPITISRPIWNMK